MFLQYKTAQIKPWFNHERDVCRVKPTLIHFTWEKKPLRIGQFILMEKNNRIEMVQRSSKKTLRRVRTHQGFKVGTCQHK